MVDAEGCLEIVDRLKELIKVKAFVEPHVAHYKRLRHVAFADAIPKSPSGKILRRVLVAAERAAAKA